MKDSEHKDLSDPSYSFSDFRVQLTGGRLRWFATILAVASVGLFVYLLTMGDKAELDFPVLVTGQAALWSVGIVFAVWTVIAIVNWRAWFRKKRAVA
jgi:membrane protein implicated in regulation of membrane protease activity